jgi:GTP-binding protein Era
VETALAAIPDADVILWLVEAGQPVTEADELVAQSLHENQQKLQRQGEMLPPVILTINKVDLLSLEERKDIEQPFLNLFPVDEWLVLSATRGDNCNQLLRRLIHHLPLGPRYFPPEQITDQQTRFIVAELIREAALKILHQEVPHALAVVVTEFKHRHENLVYISANIILERQSQKKIVIGEKGRVLKKIGQLARPQIEQLVECKVYLDLWVKIRPKWRQKENELRWLGYATK